MSIHQHLPALQVVVPMLIAPLVILMRGRGLAWAMATATSVMAFIIAVSLTNAVVEAGSVSYAMGSWQAPYGIELRVTAFSALLLLIVTAASTITLLFGKQSIDSQIEQHRQPMFYAAWLLALAGLVGIVVAGDAFNIFVFMEVSSLASYILIAAGPNRQAMPSVFKYLVMGTIGATFYLIGVGLIYMMTGTLNLADMEVRLQEVHDLKPIVVAAGFITVGLALKAAVFPLHVWLPNSYTYAPHMVTAFFAACATKVSLFVLLRFEFLVFQPNLVDYAGQFTAFLIPLAVIGILFASGVALFETHLKRLLAYSSVAQVGYILLGASMATAAGLTAGIMHMFNHALAKGALFLAIACLATQVSNLRLNKLGGIARKMPWTMAAFVVGGLSLVGIPGTAGFISKWLLISAVLEKGTLGIFLVVAVLASSLMAVVYFWRIVEVAYFGDAPADGLTDGLTEGLTEQPVLQEAPKWMLFGTWFVALANIYYGLNPSLPLLLSSQAASNLLGQLP